jgi:hypothetical protein
VIYDKIYNTIINKAALEGPQLQNRYGISIKTWDNNVQRVPQIFTDETTKTKIRI